MAHITGDPVFQLNTVLWMLQAFPDREGAVNPVLRHNGYAVRALGKRLSALPEIERALATQLNLKGLPQPDVLASAPTGSHWPIFECKSSSFSAESSTSEQASKIIARAADVAVVAGLPPGKSIPGAVVYVTRSDQAKAIGATLFELSELIVQSGLSPAPASSVGLTVEPGSGVIVQLLAGELPGPAGEVLAEPVVVVPAAGDEEMARPLYFIPFDPSVSQAPEERQYCLRVLLERGRAHAASVIGRAEAQGTAVLDGLQLLRDATYGLSQHWSDIGSRDKAAHEILRYSKLAIRQMKSKVPHLADGNNPPRIEVLLTSSDQRQACAEAIMALPLPGDAELPATLEQELPFADGRDVIGPVAPQPAGE
ncbi:MAG: hypothetical protein M3406_16100 [Chloroflexota bacterium]|nr:hypothetical protein [Chloroflexota bacterium]